jgi:hypothetical protein
MFEIYDELHAEQQAEFETLEAAKNELRRRAGIPWDQEPNVAPCLSWKTCGRKYEIIEYDDASREIRRIAALEVSSNGVKWAKSFS